MLKYEADPNYQMDIPPLSTNLVLRWLRKLMGITAREERIFLELQRLQALIVILAQHAQGIRPDHDAVAGALAEVVGQVNRQTNAISSLLDRLQFYERNDQKLLTLRKKYDKKIAEKVAKSAREEVAQKAQEQGVVLGEDETKPPLELVTDDGSTEQHVPNDREEDDDSDEPLGI